MVMRFFRCGVVGLFALMLLWLFGATTVTATRQPTACGAPPTPEIMNVEPVTSPTTSFTQTLSVRLGNGRTITATSEAGTTSITGTFSASTLVPLTLSLLPGTTHHLTVIGQVEYAPDCYYTLSRTTDKNGAPLTIRQTSSISSTVYLPLIARPGAGRSFPETTNGIFVLNDQLATASMSEAQFQFAATHYVGTQKVLRDDARRLRQYNPNFLVLHYRLGQALGHSEPNGACQPTTNYLSIIDGNQWVQEWPGDAAVQENWFYHYNSSRVFSCAYGHYVMDLNDAGWREWWSTRVISQLIDNEDDAVFADSYSVPNYFGHCAYSPCLPDVDAAFEQQWADREYAFTTYMQSRLAGHWKWLPNIGALITSRDPSNYSSLDGALIEGFAEWGTGSYFDASDWALQQNRILALTRADKILIGQTYPDQNDVNERMFVLGTYLLIKGKYTYLNLDIAMEPEWFPEYAIDLGAPLAALPAGIATFYNATWQVYARHFAKGLVLVNPSNTAHTVDLGGTYFRANPVGGGLVPSNGSAPGSVSYTAVTSLSLGPHQAAIVLHQLP
jgi:hypothetical protein